MTNTTKEEHLKKSNLTLWYNSATSARPPQVLLQAIFGPALPHIDRSHQAVLPVVAAEDWAEPRVVPGTRSGGKTFQMSEVPPGRRPTLEELAPGLPFPVRPAQIELVLDRRPVRLDIRLHPGVDDQEGGAGLAWLFQVHVDHRDWRGQVFC